MFKKLEKWYSNNKWEVMIGIAVTSLILLSIYQHFNDKDKQGTWSETFVYHGGSERPKLKPDFEDVGKESKGELMVKNILQDLTRRPWDKIRPDFLKNKVTGQNLEFDCWNEEFKIGVEIQGDQHYKYIPYFHKNYEAFRNQQYRDELKRMMAKNNNIHLIEVPYKMIKKDLRGFIRTELGKCGVYV